MYLNLEIALSEEQKKEVEEKANTHLVETLKKGDLDRIIKSTVDGIIRSAVNNEIQTKNYRKLIADKVAQVLNGGEV